ncbi:MAG TPA: DUF3060 domain-containing protein [Kofleriaceae bacterium]|jgi:hypothetical protein
MKTVLISAAVLLVPSFAFADRSWTGDHQSVTWDCKTEAVVSISGNQSSFNLTGSCKQITILGNDNRVNIDAADNVSVPGNANIVNGSHVVTISVTGHDNTVDAKGAQVSNVGERNRVTTK